MGRRIRLRASADCRLPQNLVRDGVGLARRRGVEPRGMARRMIEAEGGPARALTPEMDEAGPHAARDDDDEWGVRRADLVMRITGRDLRAVADVHDRATAPELQGNASADGRAAADRFRTQLGRPHPPVIGEATGIAPMPTVAGGDAPAAALRRGGFAIAPDICDEDAEASVLAVVDAIRPPIPEELGDRAVPLGDGSEPVRTAGA